MADVDAVIQSVLEGFLPSLEANRITPVFEPGVDGRHRIDRDVLEQILGNLIANVEKYAAEAGNLRILSRSESDRVVIEVIDGGAGIPKGMEAAIFEPFRRLSNRVSDGVAGTGIGLTIARDLARKHGGDLCLLGSEVGARFQVVLQAGGSEENS